MSVERTQKLPATSRPQPHRPRPRGGPLTLVAQQGLGGESSTQVSRGGEVWLPSGPGELRLSQLPWSHPKPPCGHTPSRAECGLTAHPADHGLTAHPAGHGLTVSSPSLSCSETSSSSKIAGPANVGTRPAHTGAQTQMSGQGPNQAGPAGKRGSVEPAPGHVRLGLLLLPCRGVLLAKVRWGQPEATQGVQGSQTGSNHHVRGRNMIRNSTLAPPMDISSEQASQGLGSSDLPP